MFGSKSLIFIKCSLHFSMTQNLASVTMKLKFSSFNIQLMEKCNPLNFLFFFNKPMLPAHHPLPHPLPLPSIGFIFNLFFPLPPFLPPCCNHIRTKCSRITFSCISSVITLCLMHSINGFSNTTYITKFYRWCWFFHLRRFHIHTDARCISHSRRH